MRKAASNTANTPIYQLKITLKGIRPPIWRRVLVSANITLQELHPVIQVAMGWHGGHLHAFRVGDTSYGAPDPDLDDWMQDERRVRLARIAPEVKSKLLYEYDFGDGWEHNIIVEKILPAEPGQMYPRCITGKRACPPEDCGGVWGYAGLLEALADPEHEQHEELLEWVGEDFDPEAFDVASVNAVFEHLLK